MPYKDKEKQKAASAKWYQENKEKVYNSLVSRRARNREWISKYKESIECCRCKENHTAVLAFHHREGEVKYKAKANRSHQGVSGLIHQGLSIKKIELEIAKCDVYCHNCHAILHFEERS